MFRLVFWGFINIYFYIVLQSWISFSQSINTTYYILCYGLSPLLIVISGNMWLNMDTMTDNNLATRSSYACMYVCACTPRCACVCVQVRVRTRSDPHTLPREGTAPLTIKHVPRLHPTEKKVFDQI